MNNEELEPNDEKRIHERSDSKGKINWSYFNLNWSILSVNKRLF